MGTKARETRVVHASGIGELLSFPNQDIEYFKAARAVAQAPPLTLPRNWLVAVEDALGSNCNSEDFDLIPDLLLLIALARECACWLAARRLWLSTRPTL